jgi:hypothetical protein
MVDGSGICEPAQTQNWMARFKIADLNNADATLPKSLRDEFVSLCHDRGMKAALAHYRGTPDACSQCLLSLAPSAMVATHAYVQTGM